MREFDFAERKVREDGREHRLLAVSTDGVFYSDTERGQFGIFSARKVEQRPLADAEAVVASDSSATIWVGSIGFAISSL